MAELKREYVVPLRRKFLTAPKWRRSKKAIAVLKDYMRKHMKCEDVIVCAELNEHIWARGSKNPPGKVEVIALRTQVGQDQKVLVNLKSVGIDEQKSMYDTAAVPSAQEVVDTPVDEKESSDETLEDKVVEAEVKEKPAKEVKEEVVEKKTKTTTTKKTTKTTTKKVVEEKKNE